MPYNVVRLGGETRIHTSTGGVQAAPQWIRAPGRALRPAMGRQRNRSGQGGYERLFPAAFRCQRAEDRQRDPRQRHDGRRGQTRISLSVCLSAAVGLHLEVVHGRSCCQASNIYFRTFDANGLLAQQVRINETAERLSELDWRNRVPAQRQFVVIWNGRAQKRSGGRQRHLLPPHGRERRLHQRRNARQCCRGGA